MVDLSNQHSRTETYSGCVRVRRNIPLFDTRVIALLTEGRLGGSFGYDKSYQETDLGKEGVFAANYSVFGGLYAGVSVFFTNFASVEIAFPVLSAGYDWSKQIEKQEYESTLTAMQQTFLTGQARRHAGYRAGAGGSFRLGQTLWRGAPGKGIELYGRAGVPVLSLRVHIIMYP